MQEIKDFSQLPPPLNSDTSISRAFFIEELNIWIVIHHSNPPRPSFPINYTLHTFRYRDYKLIASTWSLSSTSLDEMIETAHRIVKYTINQVHNTS